MRKLELAALIAAGSLVAALPGAVHAAPSTARQQASPGSDNQAARNAQSRQAKTQRMQAAPAPAPSPPPQCEALSGDPLAPAVKQFVASPQFANRVAHAGDLK